MTSAPRQQLDIDVIVPGGIKPTDHRHVDTNDGSCSRCFKEVPEDEAPLMLWSADGTRLLIYCGDCLELGGL